ncbi:BRO family protein [Pseudomonas sp. LJDD11]|uniref:BRO-N domain-containing protein n=1 Tax=Pseudomonas sp. LJDD11 TaxID=2931984 RepID=UPI00211BADA6|nr:BRO family protein [Pseudomonas sp. LJDD11]MCQ9426687.1 BRO family protein [Pseudomonas sp. LJDD11]
MDKRITNVIPFKFEEKATRTVLINNKPWFVAADVCSILGYSNSRKAIVDNCRVCGVTTGDITSDVANRGVTSRARRSQIMTLIDEGNLYRLIIKSRKEEAQRFEVWVCDEVLPSIRKHGRYEDTDNRMATLLGQTIGTDGFHMLGALIKGKVSSLQVSVQRRAKAKIWSQTHAAFGVRSAADIPADQLDAARNFIAAYALEGEWLPKPDRLEIEAGPTRRYLVSFNDAGERQIKPVPLDAFVMTHQQFIKGMLTPGDMMVSTEELIEVAMAALGHLKARSGFQSGALPGM